MRNLVPEKHMLDQRTAPYGISAASSRARRVLLGASLFEVLSLSGRLSPMVGQLRHQQVLLVRALVCSDRGGGRRVFIVPGIYARWASLYALPLMVGAVHFILVRKGFFFAGGGCDSRSPGRSCSRCRCWSAMAPTR